MKTFVVVFTVCLLTTVRCTLIEDENDVNGRQKRSTEIWRVSSVSQTSDIKTLLSPFAPLHRQWGDDSLSASTAQSSSPALHVHYRKGSYTQTSHRGAGFYSSPSAVHQNTDKLILMYDVYFKNFGWGTSGKLPGLFGGENGDGAYACSGGHNPSSCFSLRLMWRTDGQGELYAYLPHGSQESGFFGRDYVKPHGTKGISIGRGKIHFHNNAWQTVMILASLNTPGRADGYVKFCNKVSGGTQECFTVNNIAMRSKDHSSHHLRGMFFSTFFGGASPGDAAPNACDTYFKNFRLKYPTGYVIGK